MINSQNLYNKNYTDAQISENERFKTLYEKYVTEWLEANRYVGELMRETEGDAVERLSLLGFKVKESVSDTECLEYYGYTGNSCIILATGKQIKEFCEMGWIEDKYYLTLAPENLSEATEQHPMSFFFDTSNIDGYSEKLDVYFKTLVS